MATEFRILDFNYLFEPGVRLSAVGTDANFPLSNLQSYLRSAVHRSASSAAVQRVTIDLKAAAPVDSFAVIPPISGGLKYSSSAVIKLMANATNSWASPQLSVTLSMDATYGIITHFFSSTQTYRYWAYEVTDTGNGYGYIETPKLVLAKATQLTQAPEIGFPYSLADRSKASVTPYGHRYTDIYPSLKGFAFNYQALSSADLETLYLISDRIGTTKPVCVAVDPTASVWDKDRFFIYGYLRDFASSQQFYSYFQTGLAVEETP